MKLYIKTTVQAVLNKLFSLNKETNESIPKKYIESKNIKLGSYTKKDLLQRQQLDFFRLLTLDTSRTVLQRN